MNAGAARDPKQLAGSIRAAAASRGRPLDEGIAAVLGTHLGLLFAWNRRYSLTAITDTGEAIRRHVLESLEAVRIVSATSDDVLVDLGSGNGYPALPLLASWPEARGELVEVRETKVAFLRAAIRECGLGPRVTVRRERIPDPSALRADATIVTLRGFPEPARWIAGAAARPGVRAVLAWLATDDARDFAPALPAGRAAELVPLETGTLLVVR